MEAPNKLISSDLKEVHARPQVQSAAANTSIPGRLTNELCHMRRDPSAFTLYGRVKCPFGCGKGAAYNLTHPQSIEAGTWCAVHGWIFLTQ
jgi:hypothetical protein